LIMGLRKIINDCRNMLLFRIKYRWVRHGRNVHCRTNARFRSPHRHTILGNDVGIGHYCMFYCDTEIGDKVMIASQVAFLNSDEHRYDIVGKSIWDSGNGCAHKIIVEDDVWIGHGAILLSPLRIGRGSIVAAGSVVVRDVPRYSIVGGVPAKVLKMRFTPEQIRDHEAILWKNERLASDEPMATQ